MLTSSAALFRNAIDHRKSEGFVRELLEKAGITVGGSAPHDLQVHDPRFYTRLLRDGSLGMGEAYMDGWWDSPAVDELVCRLLRAKLDEVVRNNYKLIAHTIKAKLLNLQTVTRAFQVGEQHYDLGNDLYEAMLDSRMMYTCGYWKDADNLDAAQEAKLDLVCRKIGLKPGMRVLELGCGWGGFAKYAAEKYGAEITGLTVSKEQVVIARERCKGLPVEISASDYRDAKGLYDAVISIGIMEHIGTKNYRTYMEVVDRCMKPDGVALVHTIAGNRSIKHMEPWFNKYIFPNAVLPTIAALGKSMEQLLVLEDVHNIGPHYDRTLMAWLANFEAAWPTLKNKYGERFYRMWRYYLLTSAAGFRVRYTQLFQLVMTRTGTTQPDCRLS
jgi:cyclopropane-fatty-acyl-phospholipid synthase